MGRFDDIFKFKREPDPEPYRTLMTGSAGGPVTCTCDSCAVLDTAVGEAMLRWGRGLIRTVREAVELGADKELTLTLTLQGPDAHAFASGIPGGRGQKQYAELAFKLGDITRPQGPTLEPKPDTDLLREEYADDPVLLQLFDWLDGRVKG